MTEKVVSLSGGLVLGMVFALFLSVGTTGSISSSVDLDYPSISGLIGMNDMQSYRSSSGAGNPSENTTPVAAAPPAQEENRGRVIRIATVTETADPAGAAAASNASALAKNDGTEMAYGEYSSLRQIHLQHSSQGSGGSGNASYAATGMIAAGSGNFARIADESSGQGDMDSQGGQPSVVDNKPQTTGSPAVAQNDPGGQEGSEEGEGGPAITSQTDPRPGSPSIDPGLSGGGSEFADQHPQPWGPETNNGGRPQQPDPYFMQDRHKPELD